MAVAWSLNHERVYHEHTFSAPGSWSHPFLNFDRPCNRLPFSAMPVTFRDDAMRPGDSPSGPEIHIENEAESVMHHSSGTYFVDDTKASSAGGGDPIRGNKLLKKDKPAGSTNHRKWLRIDARGETYISGSTPLKLAARLGIQPRDLRFLELHAVNYTSPALLPREHAIVVSFESIRCIITLTYVLVVNPFDERVASLIEDFKAQLVGQLPSQHKMLFPGDSKLTDVADKLKFGRKGVELPFELKVLEICFDKIASELSSAATELEKEALPALDHLTKRIHAPDLEAVRRVKSKIVRLKTRLESLHEVLEKFLNDDSDMHRLNLTAEEMSRQLSLGGALSRTSRKQQRFRAQADKAEEGGEPKPPHVVQADKQGVEEEKKAPRAESVSSKSSSSSKSYDDAEVAEVEMLLEAYDMHFEQALSRLQTLDEYIQDTEDLVNTALDQKRNELITSDLLLNANIVALGLVTTVVSLLSMNIVPIQLQLAPDVFNEVAISASVGVYVVLGLFLLWAVRENLIVF